MTDRAPGPREPAGGSQTVLVCSIPRHTLADYGWLDGQKMDDFAKGLRCQDVHSGLRSVDPNSAALTEFADTRIIGMAASLAALIRGQDVVRDAQILQKVAADQLDVDPLAFNEVVEVLESVGFVQDVTRKAGKIQTFTEAVPFHSHIYSALGDAWTEREPHQLEEELLATVNRLAGGPVPSEELVATVGIEKADEDRILHIAKESDLVKVIEHQDGDVLYSPFMGFEHPEVLSEIFTQYGSDRFQEEFDTVRNYQGLPVDPAKYPVLNDAVSRGLLTAPSVTRHDGVEQPFAFAPYGIDKDLFVARRPILDKAMAVLACVRCGQHFSGKSTSIAAPAAILRALLNPAREHRLAPHPGHRRQYQLLFRMQIVDFEPSGNWVSVKLIPTEDNTAAIQLAIDLLEYGEAMEDRVDTEEARRLLMLESRYQDPLGTVQRRRGRQLRISDKEYQRMMDAMMGRAPL